MPRKKKEEKHVQRKKKVEVALEALVHAEEMADPKMETTFSSAEEATPVAEEKPASVTEEKAEEKVEKKKRRGRPRKDAIKEALDALTHAEEIVTPTMEKDFEETAPVVDEKSAIPTVEEVTPVMEEKVEKPKKRRGRPRKEAVQEALDALTHAEEMTTPTMEKDFEVATPVAESAPVMEEKAEEKAEELAAEAPAPKKRGRKKKEASAVEEKKEKRSHKEVNFIIESVMGGQISIDEIASRLPEGVENVYIKPEENKAYFTIAQGEGSIDLW